MSSIFLSYATIAVWILPFFLFFYIQKNEFKLYFSTVLTISITSTVVFYTISYFLFRLFFSQALSEFFIFLQSSLLLLSSIIYGFKKKDHFKLDLISFFKNQLSVITILCAYLLILVFYLHKNSYDENGNLVLYDLFSNEVILHLSIVSQLDYSVIPKTLQFLSIDNGTYHFFPNLFINLFSNITNSIDNLGLYLFFFLPFCSIILALNVYALARIVWSKRSIAIIAMGLSLFCYDSSALILWIKGVLTEHNFWFGTQQPGILSVWTPVMTQFQLFNNPSYLFGSAFLLGSLVVTIQYFEIQDKFLMMISIVSWVFLIKAKITAFLLGVIPLFIFGVFRLFRNSDQIPIKMSLIIIGLSLPIIFFSIGKSGNSVIFSHWYFLNNFAVRSHFIDSSTYEEIKAFGYTLTPKSIFNFLISSIAYFIGLFGIRLLIGIRKNFAVLYKKNRELNYHFLLVTMSCAGIAGTFLFSESLTPYNSMWFYLHIVFLLNIYTAERIYALSVSKDRSIKILQPIALFIIIFSCMTFLIPIFNKTYEKRIVISKDEIECYKYLRTIQSSKRVMSKYYHMYASDERNFLITAFAGKKVVMEGIEYNEFSRSGTMAYLDTVRQIRDDIERVYQTTDPKEALSISRKYNVEFILVKSPDKLYFRDQRIRKVFTSDNITLYSIEI